MNEYIKKQNEKAKTEQTAAFEKVAEENKKTYDTAQQTSDTAFAEIMRQMFDDNRRRQAETNAVLETNQLNTAEGSQAALSQGNTLRGNQYSIGVAQENARRDIDTSRQAMEDTTKAAVQQAIANADYNTANQLYTNFKTERNTAQSQVNKLLSAGVMPDNDTITKSGYDLDYVNGLYQKAQQEAAAAAAAKAEKIASIKQNAKEQASTVADAIKNAFDKFSGATEKKKGNTATLVLSNMQNLKSVDARQNYALAAYQSGAVDAQQCGQLLLLGSQAPTWNKPKVTALQLDSIDGDEAIDTQTAAKLKTTLFGSTPFALPKTIGEAQTIVANYVLDKTASRIGVSKAVAKAKESVSTVASAIQKAFSNAAADTAPRGSEVVADLETQLGSGEITQNDIIARQLAADKYSQTHFLTTADATVAEDLFMAGYTEEDVDEYFRNRNKEQVEADNEYAISVITPQERIVKSFQQQYDNNYYDPIRTDFDRDAINTIAEIEEGIWYRGLALVNNAIGNVYRTSVEFDESDLDATFRVDWNGGAPNMVEQAESHYSNADEYAMKSEEHLNAAKEGKGSVGKFLIDASVVMSDVAADTVANILVPGSGLVTMALRAYEQGEMTARQQGLDRGEQFLYGVATAGIETLTEKLFGGLKLAYGTGIADKTVGKIVTRLGETSIGADIKRFASSGLGKVVTAALGEGIEEVVADFLQPAADVAFGLADDYELNIEDIIYDGMLGSFVGLLGGSANIVAENKQRKAAEAYNAANAAQHDDTNAENTSFAAAQEAFEYAKQGASAAMQQAVEDLQSTGKVNTDEANVAAAVDAAISDDGSASITEVITPAKIYAVQKKGNDKTAVYTIVELESETSVKPTTGKMYRSEAAALGAARAKGYTIYGVGTAEQLPNIYRQTQAANAQNNQQQNIDNTVNNPYNESMNGGAANDGDRMDSGMADGVSGRPILDRRNAGAGENGRGNQELSRRNIISNLKAVLRQSGVVATELQNFDADSAAFSNALNAARTADAKNGWAVTPQSVEELQGKQLYMDANGTIGFALTEDGDIEAVFKNSETNHTKHAMDGVMPQAIATGGIKLDCYDTPLVRVYERYGFTPVCRVVFNEEYANDGWDESKGKPYIYFLMHNGDSADTVAANIGKYNHMSLEDLEKLPTFGKEEYDKAYAYRDSLLAQQQSGNGGDGLGAADAGFARQSPEIESWYADAEERGSDGFHSISDTQARLYTQTTGFAPNEVPKHDAYGQHLSRVASNAMNSQVTPEAMHNSLLENARTGKFSYVEITDSVAKTTATKQIDKDGWDKSLRKFKDSVEQGKTGKILVTKGLLLYNNAVTAGNYLEAIDILSYVQQAATSAAQTVQAMKILAKLSPDCQLYGAVKGIDNVLAKVAKRYGLDTDIEVNEALLEDYHKALKSGDEEMIKQAWGKVEKDIADKIPSDWRDKLSALRYLSMLGNPRTHIRNIGGNLGFALPRVTSNVVATTLEIAAGKISGGKFERTKAFIDLANPNDKALWAVAWNDYSAAEAKIMREGKLQNAELNNIDKERKIFKGWDTKSGKHIENPIEKLGDWNTKALEAEDMWFARPAYTAALTGYLKANGISAQEYANGVGTDERMTKAQEYAIKEAQKATYRDANAFSDFVSKLRVKPTSADATLAEKAVNAAGTVVVESMLPYKRTPANILVRAVEYSPLGYVELAGQLIYAAKHPNARLTGAEIIAKLSQGLTGTGLVGLGVWLAAEGILRGNNDDDEKSLLDREQAYSITVGDTNITLDWLAPEILPIMVGVEIYNEASKQEGFNVWGYLESLSNLAEPLTVMSMLQGVQDMVDSLGNSDNIVSGFAVQATAGYLSQFLPTLGGQVERSIEDKRQTTFIDRNSDVPTDIQYILGKAFNKNPFAEYQQIDYYDAWGRSQETGNVFERIANNFLNPAYVNEVLVEDVEAELERLDKLGESGMYPSKPSQSEQINGEYLTAEEYEKYSKLAGQLKLKTVGEVRDNGAYENLSDADKAEVIRDAYSYATAIAKNEVNSDYEVPSWVEKAEEYGDVSTYIIARQGISNLSDRKKDTVCEYINSLDISKSQKSKLYELMYPNYKNDYRWR